MTRDQTPKQEPQEAEGPDQVDGLCVGLQVVGQEGLHGSSDGLDGSVTELPHPGNADIADAPGDLSWRQLGKQFFHSSSLFSCKSLSSQLQNCRCLF